LRPAHNTDAAGGSRTLLAQSLLAALQAGLLKVYLDPPQFRVRVSRCPEASPLARLLATRRNVVVNQVHDNVVLDNLQVFLLPRLDGTRDVPALIQEAQQAIAEGGLTLSDGNQPISQSVERALSQLCSAFLLVG